MKPDERSFRIALVADRYVNPADGEVDGLAVAAKAGWGVMQLPAADYPAAVTAPVLATIAEELQEFSRHGYDIVQVGDCTGLATALAAAGLSAPDRMTPGTDAELLEYLRARPAPPVSTWSWLAKDQG
ncbi:MAG TPA: hypothetical protein VGI64_09620 [Streptosporangiaceae bacterium]